MYTIKCPLMKYNALEPLVRWSQKICLLGEHQMLRVRIECYTKKKFIRVWQRALEWEMQKFHCPMSIALLRVSHSHSILLFFRKKKGNNNKTAKFTMIYFLGNNHHDDISSNRITINLSICLVKMPLITR